MVEALRSDRSLSCSLNRDCSDFRSLAVCTTVLSSPTTSPTPTYRMHLVGCSPLRAIGSNSSRLCLRAARACYGSKTTVAPKKKVVILGCGWGGFRLAQDIDKSLFDVVVVSPRNHFLFTPLLPSTAVGTLEFRCIQEPVRTIPGVEYVQAACDKINFDNKSIECEEIFKKRHFVKNFDYLFLAVGSETNTFGVPGVTGNSHVFFLKQLQHARAIRNRLLECFERASAPDVSAEERRRLLTFVVVGGGPTNIEFASELHDFLHDDVTRWYPDLKESVHVVVVEASQNILGSFKSSLVDYVEKLFTSRNIKVLTKTAIKEVKENVAVLGDGSSLPFGVMVWSTGIKQVGLVENVASGVASSANKRLLLDGHLRLLEKSSTEDSSNLPHVPIAEGSVFALGDCGCDVHRPLPALAQVAAQQGKFSANLLNKYESTVATGLSSDDLNTASIAPFQYAHLGSMASVGSWKGVYDSTNIGTNTASIDGPPVKGFLAFALWRMAYWTKQVSMVNKVLIPMYWLKSAVFGRDISRF